MAMPTKKASWYKTITNKLAQVRDCECKAKIARKRGNDVVAAAMEEQSAALQEERVWLSLNIRFFVKWRGHAPVTTCERHSSSQAFERLCNLPPAVPHKGHKGDFWSQMSVDRLVSVYWARDIRDRALGRKPKNIKDRVYLVEKNPKLGDIWLAGGLTKYIKNVIFETMEAYDGRI